MKNKKLIKNIVVFCILIIFIELLIMLVIKISREREIVHLDSLNDVIITDNGYIGVGESDFKYSKFVDEKKYQYKDNNIIATRCKIAIYDKDKNLIKENTFDSNYDSSFYGVLKVSDGYIAVGSIVSDSKQIEVNVRNALMVKYDNDLNVIWSKTYSVLSDTEFYKIIDDGDDNYVIIGQSIYENMELGNHITGGGIIVRINKDGEVIAHNNYGGNKSGNFSDIIKVNDGYIVCGKDATNYGIIVKFKKDFNREDSDNGIISKKVMWQRTYANTDNEGFTDMALIGDTIYACGAINISDEKDKDGNPIFKYDAGIVLYNTSGKYLSKTFTLNDDIHNLFTSIESDDKYLYLTALLDTDNLKNNRKSMLVKYDLDGKIIEKTNYDEKNNNVLTKIIKENDKFMVIGTSNTKCSFISGCDYEPLMKVYNNELKINN